MTREGFVDLHTHGLGRFDTRSADHRAILKMADLHARSGTVMILPTIYPGPVSAMREQIEAVRRAAEAQQQEGRTRETAASALIAGVHLEGPFLNPDFCGALGTAHLLKPSRAVLRSLIAGFEDFVKVITVAPELPGARAVIRTCADMGMRVNMGHSGATFRQALEGKKAGATGITHLFNAMRPLHHREPGLAGFGMLDDELYVELIADGIHLHLKTIELVFAVKRLDRIIIVSDTVAGPRSGKGAVYDRGGALAGSATTLRGMIEVLRSAGVPEAEILEATVDNPLRYIRVR